MTRILIGVLLFACVVGAADYHTAPSGSPSCDGSAGCSWDLQTGLNKPLVGGDRLLLSGGIYQGNFTSALNGNGSQIIVQPADPSFQPRLDGSLTLSSGGYVTIQYLEVFNSNTNRTIAGGMDCITAEAPSIVLIHNIIHDCATDGVGFWSSAPNSMAYGNLIYYVGYNASDRGHGHGMYIQSNNPDWKLIQDNVVLNNFGYGLHSYTEGGHIDNITYRGNTVYANGSLVTTNQSMNILMGGLVVAQNPVWDLNVAYYPSSWTSRPSANLGYSAGTNHANVTGNYLLGGYSLYEVNSANAVFTGNWLHVWGEGSVLALGSRPEKKSPPRPSCLIGNTCGAPPLTVLVRSSLYEPGRAIVTVINIARMPVSEVSVPVASLGYSNGQTVEVVTVEDYYGTHRSFQVVGGSITLPLTGWTIATPIGWSKPASTLPTFGAFVLRRTF